MLILQFGEVIVVNDNSTDGTYGVVIDFSVEIDRVNGFYGSEIGKNIDLLIGVVLLVLVESSFYFLTPDVWLKADLLSLFFNFPRNGVVYSIAS